MKVEIIMLSWNSLDWVKTTLSTFWKFNTYDDYHLTVIDNASEKESLKYLRKTKIPDEVVFLEENVGFPKGVNLGIQRANPSTEFFLLMNSDLIITPKFIEKMLKVLDENPRVGIVAPIRCGHPNGSYDKFWIVDRQFTAEGLTVPEYEFDKPRDYWQLEKDVLAYNEKLEKYYPGRFSTSHSMIPFFCTIIRKKLFDELGLLDEDFGYGLTEDTYFCALAKQRGWRLATCLDNFVYHAMSQSFVKFYKSHEGISQAIKINHQLMERKKIAAGVY